jgi:8-amino-7-oxononanoate synthase
LQLPTVNDRCRDALNASENAGTRRVLTHWEAALAEMELMRCEGAEMQRYINFSSNDYLGLVQNPEVVEAAREAALAYGVGAGASRLITGNHPLYALLETRLAQHKHTEAALIFGSGMLANLGAISALVGDNDLILADKIIHASMLDGAKLSGATLRRFRHNDMAHLRILLNEHRGKFRHCLIMSESVFSMDGDTAPLAELSAITKESDAWLLIDDAHGMGIVPVPDDTSVDIWIGTLSKSLGSYGGYVAGSRLLIDFLTSQSRSLIYTTGLPPSVIAAADVALQIMQREPERGAYALEHAQRITQALGLPLAESAIVPIIIGSNEQAIKVAHRLAERGFWVQAIRSPTVPNGSARLRITTSYAHTETQIDGLIAALQETIVLP